MREFRNPGKIFGGLFGGAKPKTAPVMKTAAVAAPTTGDGDPEPKKKKTRGVSTQRATLLTAGSSVGASTARRTLLGSA